MKQILQAFLFLLIFPALSFSQTTSWQKLPGLYGGAGKVQHGKDGYEFLVFEDAYIYRSSDAGASWTKMTIPLDIYPGTFTVSTNGDLLVSSFSGLYRSTDNGASWGPINVISNTLIYELPGGVLLVSDLQNQIQRSADNGQTWQVVASLPNNLQGFKTNPYTGDVYAWLRDNTAQQTGTLLRSSDEGLTWSTIYQNDLFKPYSIAFSPSGAIFVGCADLLYRSVDNGATWTSSEGPLYNSGYEIEVAVSTNGRAFVSEANASVYSDNDGDSWHNLTDAAGNQYKRYSVLPSGRVFANRREGSLYYSDDNGASWHFSATGIMYPSLLGMKIIDDTHLLALTYDGLFYSSDGGTSWNLVWDEIAASSLSFLYRNLLEVSPDGSWYLWNGAKLIRFTNEGQNHTETALPPGASLYSFGLLYANPNNSTVYMSFSYKLYVSYDQGQSWQESPDHSFGALTQLQDGSLLGTDYHGIYRSTDDAHTWTLISNPGNWLTPPKQAANGLLYGTAFLNSNNAQILISPDNGYTWDRIPSNFNGSGIKGLVVDNFGFIYLYKNGINTVYRSIDGGHSFNPLPQATTINVLSSLPNLMSLDPSQHLYLIQQGLGIYRTDEPTTSVKIVSGQSWHDRNSDCQLESPADTLLPKILVKASKNGQQTYGYSTLNSRYLIPVEPGNWQFSAIPPSEYWGTCIKSLSVDNNNNIGIIDSTDVGLKILTECPLAAVNITVPRFRRCFNSTVYVDYHNTGTVTAQNAYLEITLDSLTEYVDATLPLISQNGNTFTFQLGDLAIQEHGAMQLTVKASCNAALGYVHCVQAHIYPDVHCPALTGPHIRTSAECLGDSVRLIINNVGDASTGGLLNWYAIDNDLFSTNQGAVATGTFSLGAGESFSTTIPSGFNLLDFFAQQAPGYPYNTVSQTSIQGCKTPPGISPLSIFSSDDEGPATDISCRRNIGAFDPNDIQGFPAGLPDQGYIPRDQQLEYLIRFQNTGTDTAFNITVRDTLPVQLDPASVQLLNSSHPCSLRLSSDGVLLFVFENIQLPDSNINEATSHGFVRFSVKQKPGLANGENIRNRAAIYFDFNDPVATNQTLHTVGLPVISGTDAPAREDLTLDVSPNPFREAFTLRLDKDIPLSKGLMLRMYNAEGVLCNQTQIADYQTTILRNHLPGGLYFVVVQDANGKIVGTGRVMAE